MKLEEIQGKRTFVLRALAPKSFHRESILDRAQPILFMVERLNGEHEFVGAFREDSGIDGFDMFYATFLGYEADVSKLPRLGRFSFGKFIPL
jgi:hypothetical protein